jgi:hypothetical protein
MAKGGFHVHSMSFHSREFFSTQKQTSKIYFPWHKPQVKNQGAQVKLSSHGAKESMDHASHF